MEILKNQRKDDVKMFKKLFTFLMTAVFVFCCCQAIFANTTITDDRGNICVYDNASHLVKMTLSTKYSVIGSEAFCGGSFSKYNYLRVVVIPNSYTKLESGAFRDCTALQKVYFEPNSKLKEIEAQCFYNCLSLKDINLPNGLKSIGKWAFTNCFSLYLKIPSSVTYIGPNAFGGNKYKNLDPNGLSGFEFLVAPESESGGSDYGPVPHIYYNGPASDRNDDLPKQLHKWGAKRRN